VQIRVEEWEKSLWSERARACGESLSEWVRRAARGLAGDARPIKGASRPPGGGISSGVEARRKGQGVGASPSRRAIIQRDARKGGGGGADAVGKGPTGAEVRAGGGASGGNTPEGGREVVSVVGTMLPVVRLCTKHKLPDPCRRCLG